VSFEGVDAIRLLQSAMKVAEYNQRLIANNIANADTPNYNPVRLDFQAALRASLEGRDRVSLRKTQAGHLDMTLQGPRLESLASLSKNDYNKVDLDQELLALSENTGNYTTYGSLLVKKFQGIKNMLSSIR
jgi:flagellar basal-body rod protein FlgB